MRRSLYLHQSFMMLAIGSAGCAATYITPQTQSIASSEYLFETAPFASCHASTLVEPQPDILLAAYFGGSAEGKPDVAIWTSRMEHGVWSPPEKIAVHDGVPCWNPVLFHARSGELLLFYKAGPSPQTWSGFLKHSTDAGRTWSAPEPLPAGILGPIKNKPIELDDGHLVCGSSVESYKAWSCWIEITLDQGRTWSKQGPIVVPGQPNGIIQPTVFKTTDGHLRLLCRSKNIGRICTSTSNDGGRTWSDAQSTDLPNPNSGIDAVRLADGRIVLVYNHSSSERWPLNVAISKDNGEHFTPALMIESQPGEYSYPAVIQTADGRIHITYTWNRQRIKHVSIAPSVGKAGS